MKHVFIINPHAGKGRIADLALRIRTLLHEHGKDHPGTRFEIVMTRYPGHATEIAREVSSRETSRIYAVGGDGTINEVLNGMAESDSSLACIPVGTGGDFVQHLMGASHPMDILRDTIAGTEAVVDVGRINDRYFLNVANLGFDAKVNANAQRFKKLPLVSARFAYYGGILTSLTDLSPVTVRLTCNGETRTLDLFLMAVCNGTTYGGGYLIAPQASITDGLFDVIEVGPLRLRQIIEYLPKLKNGTHIGLPGISRFQTDRFQLSADSDLIISVDGETMYCREVDLQLRAGQIRLVRPVTPRDPAEDRGSVR